MSAVSRLMNLNSSKILEKKTLKAFCYKALKEALNVARASGAIISKKDTFISLVMITTIGGPRYSKSSLCEDLYAKRPTEVKFIYASVLEKADNLLVHVPTMKSLYALVKGKRDSFT